MDDSSLPEEMEAFERQLSTSQEPFSVWLRYLDWVNSQPRSLKQKYLPVVVDRCVDFVSSSEAGRKHSSNPRLLTNCYTRAALDDNPVNIFKWLFQKKIGTFSADFFIQWASEFEKKEDLRSALQTYKLGLSSSAEPAELLSKRVQQVSAILKIKGDSPEVSDKENVLSHSSRDDDSQSSASRVTVIPAHSEKVDPYVKMVYSASHTASIEEHLAAMHHHQRIHGGTKSTAKKALDEMPPRIFKIYFKRLADVGWSESTFDDIPPKGKLVVPCEVAGGAQMSLEEFLLSRPKYSRKDEEDRTLLQCVSMDIDEDESMFSKSVMGPPSMSVSKLMTSNVELSLHESMAAPPALPLAENSIVVPTMSPNFSMCEPLAPPPPEEVSTFFTSSHPPPVITQETGAFESTVNAPLQPDDRTVSFATAPPPPRFNQTQRFEETTVFTRQARREMSDLWFHGDTACEEPSINDDKHINDTKDFSVACTLGQTAPSPLPPPEVPPKQAFGIFEDLDDEPASKKTEVALEAQQEEPAEEEVVKPVEPAFDVFVDPSCVEEPEPATNSNETWAPDEDFTLGFFHNRTKFQAIAKQNHLESTPMERRGRRTDIDEGDTVQTFKKPVVPPSTVKRPRARASLMPAMSPLVETSREYYHSSGSCSGKSRYSKSSSSSSSDFDATNLRKSMPVRLGPIRETGDSVLNATEVTEVDTSESVRAKLRRNPFNDTLKLSLASMCGRDVVDFPFLNRISSTSYEDIVSESCIKLSDGQSHHITMIRDLFFDQHEDTNTLLTVARSDGPCVFVKLMEPANRWEIHCWAEFMSRSGLPAPKGAVLSDNRVAFVELLQCRDFANESLAKINDFHVANAVDGRLPEVFVLSIVWNLVILLEQYHSCQMVVANFPLENIFISGIPDLEKSSFPSVFIADLSSAIDMTQFPANTKFKTSDLGDEPRKEFRNLAEWSYELDYAGVVKVMFYLLYPQDRFDVWKNPDGTLVAFYHFKRSYVFRNLWADLAEFLLNPGEGVDVLGKVKERIATGSEITVLPTEEQLRLFEASFNAEG